ncbi:hypothetical protein CEXT_646161 [Caerostris extrusa]|uniref:Transmembrane protein n=1 Tax=Caerostris extrusa TaxID=172846 RepID=A0AAV4XE89_CAEEX|nr:hypothetical protein CEXT_646161 [Caerostris extrusa]
MQKAGSSERRQQQIFPAFPERTGTGAREERLSGFYLPSPSVSRTRLSQSPSPQETRPPKLPEGVVRSLDLLFAPSYVMTFIDPPCIGCHRERGAVERGSAECLETCSSSATVPPHTHFYLFVSRAQRVGLFCLPLPTPPALSAARPPVDPSTPFPSSPENHPFSECTCFLLLIFLSFSLSLFLFSIVLQRLWV